MLLTYGSLLVGQSTVTEFPKLSGPYLGQKPPGMTPEVFAPGVISAERDLHSCPVFPKDGKYVLWRTMNSPSGDGIFYMEQIEGNWTEPLKAPYLNDDDDVPCFPYDDHTLFFISKKNKTNGQKRIWQTKITNGKWEEPQRFAEFDPSVDLIHWQFTISKTGNIYLGGITKDGVGN
jgi:hypothetical protein